MTSERKGPDFVGVGMQKCGTSWVADMLAQHPGVLMRKKEINFFVRYYSKGYRWYESWFRDRGTRVAGEFTQSYMISPREDSAHREFYPNWNPRRALLFWRRQPDARLELHKHYPAVKVFAVFRDPADRAWSAYWYWYNRKQRLGKRMHSFERMWRDDGRWIRTRGYYAHYLTRWREIFPDIGVFFYDDILADPLAFARRIYRFVGIDDTFAPATDKYVNRGSYTPMPAQIRQMLIDTYRDDIEQFQAMTGRDLSAWLTV